jgi:nitroimidazol reductase NimA-like FMN-containing flavoprotein (pyridoxamine 5'-phosphate oxidase superfamily)
MVAIKKESKAVIRKKMIDFLNATSGQVDPKPGKYGCGLAHKNSLVLATCANNKPRATTLEFFNEGLTIYILGEPGGKIANIRRNPAVSAVVYEQPLDHSKVQKHLQIFGNAELVSMRNNPRLFRSKVKKWNFDYAAKKLMSPMIKEKKLSDKEAEQLVNKGLSSLNLIKISPHHIILKEYYPSFVPKKYEWKKNRS